MSAAIPGGVFANEKALEIIQGLHVDDNQRAASAPELSHHSNHNNAHSLRGVNRDRCLA